jgi:hypothetical protein
MILGRDFVKSTVDHHEESGRSCQVRVGEGLSVRSVCSALPNLNSGRARVVLDRLEKVGSSVTADCVWMMGQWTRNGVKMGRTGKVVVGGGSSWVVVVGILTKGCVCCMMMNARGNDDDTKGPIPMMMMIITPLR